MVDKLLAIHFGGKFLNLAPKTKETINKMKGQPIEWERIICKSYI